MADKTPTESTPKATKTRTPEQKAQETARKRVHHIVGEDAGKQAAVEGARAAGKSWTEIETSLLPAPADLPAVTPSPALATPAAVVSVAIQPTTPAPTPAAPIPSPIAPKPTAAVPATPAARTAQKAASTATVSEAIAATKAQTDTIGQLVWMGIEPSARVKRDVFEQIMKDEGLEGVLSPPDIRDRTVVRKALFAFEQDGLVRKIREDAADVVYGTVSEAKDTAHDQLTYSQNLTIYFHKKEKDEAKQLAFTGGSTADHTKIRQMVEEYKLIFSDSDLRAWVIRSLRNELGAVVVRDNGGVYYLPPTQVETLARMNQVLGRVASGCFVEWVGLRKTGIEQKAIGRAAVTQMREQVKQLVDKMHSNLEDEGTRKGTIENRIEDFKAFRAQLRDYRDLLAFQAEDIEKTISDSEKVLATKLGTF